MSSDASPSKPSGILTNIIWLIFQITLLFVILLSVWFACSIVSDGIDSKLIAFDSEPSEGWDYWQSKYRYEAYKGWAVPGLLTVSILGWLMFGVFKTLRRINSFINKI